MKPQNLKIVDDTNPIPKYLHISAWLKELIQTGHYKADEKLPSEVELSKMCGVNRNTVGLWIRSRKLHAVRKGRNYTIPASELLFFLRSSGREIPAELAEETSLAPHFRVIQPCWD